MQLVMLTKTLQTMVGKVAKGAGNNKLLPITSMLSIRVSDKILSLTTTDMNNYVTIKETGINCEDFSTVIMIDTFSKIVAKTTSETMTIEITDSSLKLIGNGTYNIPLCTDEEGNLVNFPSYSFPEQFNEETVKYITIKNIIDTNGSCIAGDMTTPCLTGYYFGSNTITTDSAAICITKSKVFNESMLISTRVMDLFTLLGTNDITVRVANDKIMFITKDIIIGATLMTEIDDYPAEAIESYLTAEFGSKIKVDKISLLGVLERMSIFTDNIYDNNTVTLTFSNKGLILNNKDNTATEVIKFVGNETDVTNYTCDINIETLKSMSTSCKGDNITIYYAHSDNNCIKLEDDNVVKIIALDDENIDEEDEEEVSEDLTIEDLV